MSVVPSKSEKEEPKTPQQSNRAVRDVAFFSPTRAARVEEQKELTTLNKRLEHLIFQNREAEASQKYVKRQLQQLQDRNKAELLRQKQHYEQEIDARRAERDNLVAKNGKKDTEIQLLQNQLAEVNKNFESEQERRQYLDTELLERTEELNKQIEDLKTENRQLKSERDRVGHDLDKAQHRVDRLENDEKGLRQKHDDAVDQLNDALAQTQAITEDFNLMKSQFDQKSSLDSAEIADLTEKNQTMERRLRAEFSGQMNELIVHRVNQCEAEKDVCIKEMRKVHDQKLTAFREKVEQQQKEISQKDKERADMEQNFRQRHNKLIRLEHERESLRRQVKDLIKSLDEADKKPQNEVEHYKVIVRKMKDAYKRKEAEFDSLMDTKIALAMEMKAYRTMLESEEERLGVNQQGSKKRRRRNLEGEYDENRQSSSSSSDQGGEEQKGSPQRSPSILISQVDIAGGSVTVRNCLTRDVKLDGYTLVTGNEGNTFAFPEGFKLAAGATVKILSDPKAEDDPPHSLAWRGSPFSADSGDVVKLVSSTGVEVSRSAILHETRGSSNCRMM